MEITATKFFRQAFDVITQARSEQELANQEKRAKWLVCSTCGENIRILGGKKQDEIMKPGKNFHFAHLHNSKDCPIKTTSKYSREDVNRMRYRGISEGKPHIELKEELYQGLNLNAIHKGQVTELQLERVIRSLEEFEWRKPDINLLFKGRRLAVELQLSTTWLDVIVGRQVFYRQEGIFILWIFNEFDHKDSTRKLAFSDIIYTNNYNAFIFDEEARAATLKEKDLVLKCYFQHHYANNDRVLSKWETQLVTLDQLTFDQETLKVYFRDIALEKRIAAESVRKYKAQQEKETEDRKRERNRLRGVRLGYEGDHKKLKSTLADTGKEIEKLERQLKDNRQKLNSSQSDLTNVGATAKDIANRLDSYWRSLPPTTEMVKISLVQIQKELNDLIRSLEERLINLTAKDNYYRKGRVKRVNGIEYYVLDRSNRWEYITQNANRILAYHNGQANNLFASPELQPLNSHKVMQMRYTQQVEFVIDLSEEFAANTVALAEVDKSLQTVRAEKVAFDQEAPDLIEHNLHRHYKELVERYQQDILPIQQQLEEKQSERERLEVEADEIFYKIIDLDYLDHQDEDESYH